MAFTSDGRELVVAAGGPTYHVRALVPPSVLRWDVPTRRLLSRADCPDSNTAYLTLSPGGRFLAFSLFPKPNTTPQDPGVFRVRDTRRGDVCLDANTPRPNSHFDFDPGATRLYASTQGSPFADSATLWDLVTGQRILTSGYPAGFLSADGRELITIEVAGSANLFEWLWPFKLVEPDRRIRVIDLFRGRSKTSRTLQRGQAGWTADTIYPVAPTPDRTRFVDTRLRVWRVPG